MSEQEINTIFAGLVIISLWLVIWWAIERWEADHRE